jgi:hypothetical protein
MRRILQRLRPAGLLALLAILLMAAHVTHVHAAAPVDQAAAAPAHGDAGPEEDGQGKAPGQASCCALCHLPGGVAPVGASLPAPAILALRTPPVLSAARPDPLAPDRPARPPRRARPA